MLKVKIEIHPHGSEDNKRVINEIYIANTLEGTQEFGTYHAWLDTDPRQWLKAEDRPEPHAALKGFDRTRGATALVAEVIKVLEDKKLTKMRYKIEKLIEDNRKA